MIANKIKKVLLAGGLAALVSCAPRPIVYGPPDSDYALYPEYAKSIALFKMREIIKDICQANKNTGIYDGKNSCKSLHINKNNFEYTGITCSRDFFNYYPPRIVCSEYENDLSLIILNTTTDKESPLTLKLGGKHYSPLHFRDAQQRNGFLEALRRYRK